MSTSHRKNRIPEATEKVPVAWRDSFLKRTQAVQAKRGQTVIAQGSSSSDVFYIKNGKVQFSLIGENGKQSVFGELGAGHIFGEMAAIEVQPRSVSVTAIEDCNFGKIPADEFIKFMSDEPQAGLWVAKRLSSRARKLTEKTFELSTLPVAARLQSELLRLAGEYSDGSDECVIDGFPTHAGLAARIGTHREAITRELRTLTNEGIVSQEGRVFKIESIRRLRDVV